MAKHADAAGQELKIQVRGYEVKGISASVSPTDSAPQESEVHESMADHLFKVLHGSNNLATTKEHLA